MPTQVEWRDIEDFPNWGVSENGLVVSDWTSRAMAINQNQQGLAIVKMTRDGKQFTRSLALLVAKAYLEPPPNPAYNSIVHLNGDRMDCRATNLMWRPRWYALRYHAMFDDMPYRVSVYIPAIDSAFDSLREFCTTYGLVESYTYIDMCNHEPCFHYGWIVENHEE